jgi:hypothetical protein
VAELVAIPGIGQRKLDDFGAEVLALVSTPSGPAEQALVPAPVPGS